MTDTIREQYQTPSKTAMLAELERIGFRLTHPRRVIVEQIAQLGAQSINFTGDELWHMLRAHSPGSDA
jgi:hypothetical protein